MIDIVSSKTNAPEQFFPPILIQYVSAKPEIENNNSETRPKKHAIPVVFLSMKKSAVFLYFNHTLSFPILLLKLVPTKKIGSVGISLKNKFIPSVI